MKDGAKSELQGSSKCAKLVFLDGLTMRLAEVENGGKLDFADTTEKYTEI